MTYALGVVLFALAILVSIALHEAGHMLTAKRFGMKVTQYFVGFGPTLWSFRRGETEYGLKAIPAGGFCKIVGMTPMDDDVLPEDQQRAFWRQPTRLRTIVLSAGSLTHFALGFVLLYVCALTAGLPVDPRQQPATIESASACVVTDYEVDPTTGDLRPCREGDPAGPARKAGLRAGDRIVAVAGRPTPTEEAALKVVRSTPPGPAEFDIVRGGRPMTLTVELIETQRPPLYSTDPNKREKASAIGVYFAQTATKTYGPVAGIGQSASYAGRMFTGTFTAIGHFPSKIPNLLSALTGNQRDAGGPISVVGASRVGGEAVSSGGVAGAVTFLLLLAGLNIFIGVFNLFPLLPLDGGHIAIIWYERVRSWLALRRGRPDPGRVDYARLLPVTYLVILVFGGLSLLTIAADIVNPIRLFP
ncbi:MAG: site-2 protease family protein [Actinomycetota bacterium]|nr:site-2 protease family protein [Actinomycetota bacterium]